MNKVFFMVPGSLDRATGGFGYLRRIIEELKTLGWTVTARMLSGPYPEPSDVDRLQAAEAFAVVPDGSLVVVDGLALGTLPDLVERHAERLKLMALVHHPLAHETGLRPQSVADFHRSERAALKPCRAVIATSARTAAILCDEFGVAPAALSVVMPGTERFGRAPMRGDPPVVLCLGAVIPRKGHDVLIAALSRIADIDWRCRIVGEIEGAWAQDIVRRAAPLGARVTFTGPVAQAGTELLGADLFVLPSRYEGYGMAYCEALACGLPMIGCPVGVVPEILPPDAGIIVAVDDVEALAGAVRTLLGNAARRSAMATAAFEAGRKLPKWSQSGRLFSDALRRAAA